MSTSNPWVTGSAGVVIALAVGALCWLSAWRDHRRARRAR